MTRRLMLLCLFAVLATCLGCGGEKAVEGNVKVDSTDVPKRLHGHKSPPAKVPPP